MSETISFIPCALIDPGDNDRKQFDENALMELAVSIDQNGLAQPITVRPLGERYQIVAGERRFRAVSQYLQWEAIPAIVRDLTDDEAAAIMLVENTSRVDLNPIEEAHAYQVRVDKGWDIERIAATAGKSADLVKRRLNLLKLVDEVQHLIAHGHFPIGHAETLVGLDVNRQRIAFRIYNESGGAMTLSQFRHVVSTLLQEQNQDSLFDLENFWIKQVQESAAMPKRGKLAYTGAPVNENLPKPRTIGVKDTTAALIDRYIADLQSAGHRDAAAAIGTVYDALVKLNFLSVPDQSELLRAQE